MSFGTTTTVVATLCFLCVVSANNNLELYDDYVLLASDVQDWSGASCVFIMFGGNDESLAATTLMAHLQREFSNKSVLSLSANYTEILDKYRGYYNRILRPLIVVLLSSEEDVISFRDTTQAYDMSKPQWLIIFMDPRMSFCKRPKNNIFNVKFDTNMLVKCYADSNLREWYSVHAEEIITYDFALWDPVMRFRLNTNTTLHERRRSIGGKLLRIATVMESPFVQLESQKKGLFEQIVEELAITLNFTYEVIYKEASFGIQDPTNDNKWTGVVGRIVNGEADIGVGEIAMTVERVQVVDFTVPLVLSRNRLYMKPPSGSVVHWSSYSRAFDYQIWIVLGIIQALAALLITLIKLSIERKPIAACHISENYLLVWGTFCQQGLADFPTATPLRIAFLSLLLTSIIILAIYSACLISYLTLTVPSLPFNDLESFITIGTYKLITLLGSSDDQSMFNQTKDPLMMKMKNLRMDRVHLPKTVMGGFRRVCEQDKVAFYASEAVKEQLNAWLPCDLVSIDTGRFDSLGMVLTKGNPYTGVINYQLQKFKDYGIMNRLKRTYFMNAASSGNEYQPVSLRGILPLVVVFLAGLAISAVLFLMEIAVSRAYHTLTKNKSNRRIETLY